LFIPTVTVIVNALSAVCPSASVALIVNEYCVSLVAPDSVPVNVDVPLALLSVIPPGKVPDTFAIETELVAVKFIVPKLEAAAKDPKDPADVVQAGASETVKT
jgi:hypothetical protein